MSCRPHAVLPKDEPDDEESGQVVPAPLAIPVSENQPREPVLCTQPENPALPTPPRPVRLRQQRRHPNLLGDFIKRRNEVWCPFLSTMAAAQLSAGRSCAVFGCRQPF